MLTKKLGIFFVALPLLFPNLCVSLDARPQCVHVKCSSEIEDACIVEVAGGVYALFLTQSPGLGL